MIKYRTVSIATLLALGLVVSACKDNLPPGYTLSPSPSPPAATEPSPSPDPNLPPMNQPPPPTPVEDEPLAPL